MGETTKKKLTSLGGLIRLVDANLNRLREAIRVLEDISRFVQNDTKTAKILKSLRHKSRIKNYRDLLKARDIQGDCLKQTTKSELQRQDLKHVVLANFKRSQESTRVLEECLKLFLPKDAQKFKEIRYELYELEAGFDFSSL